VTCLIDLLVNYFAKQPGRSLIWMERLDRPPWFKKHVLGPEHVGVSHGNAIGDINGDGRNDVVTTDGWFEAPPRPTEDQWTWHPDYRFPRGGAGHPILVTDTNDDGLADIIMGSAHEYGLVCYRQRMENGKRTFIEHWIEADGRTISVPLAWSWRLADATPAQRKRFEIIGDGEGVHWPDIDEDISARGMLQGILACPPRQKVGKRRGA
jgi:hypothetical protein